MEEDINPFQSPGKDSSSDKKPPLTKPRTGRTPHAKDYANLSLQLKLLGGAIILLGLILLCVSLWSAAFALCGVPLVVIGYGMAAYKPWAWYGAVTVLVPSSALLIVATIVLMISAGTIGLALLMAPAYMWYVLWVLCSRNGRQRYRDTREAILRARANPDSIAGKLISGKVRGRL